MLTQIAFRRVFLLVCCMFLVPRVASAEWTFPPIVDVGPGARGFYMVMDSNNKMHITYESWIDPSQAPNSGIRYVTNASGSWVTSTISILYAGGPEIAVDSLNRPHISWRGCAYPELGAMYATNASGTWVTETIATGIDTYGGSVAVGSNNKVHLAYVHTVFATLYYATNASGSWIITPLDSVPPMIGGYRSLALDSQNKVHIAYCLDNAWGATLKYATNASGSWVITTVDDSVAHIGFSVDIALDSNDKVHISYLEGPAPWTNTVKYATNASGSWVRRTIDPTAHTIATSIALDSNNKVHISYDDPNLKYATNRTGDWVISVVDDTPIQSQSVTVDSYDNIHIVYWDMVPDDLKYATTAVAATVSCNGFEPPCDGGPIKVRKNRVIPLKAELINSSGTPITGEDISAPPVVQVMFQSGTSPAIDVSDEALSVGQGSEGNQFVYTDGKWQFNLQTKNYTAVGTYTVTMESGDEFQYIIQPTCNVQFVIDD